MPDVLIVGGGLAGLSAAHTLGERAHLVERDSRVGGLTRSEVVQGFGFDWTGHWLHLRDPGVRSLVEELLPGQLLTVERRAAVYSHGVFTPYPYQIHTHGLPAAVVAENVLGFVEATVGARGPDPRSFLEYVLRHMGAGFAKNFFVPYNQKLFQVPLDELSPEWVGRFVPRPALEDVVAGAFGLVREGAGYNATFVYPRQGGIEALPRALLSRLACPVETGAEVVAIDAGARTVRLADGRTLGWRRLVATLPLPEIVARLVDAPDEVRAAAARLRAVSVTVVEIGLAKDEGPRHHWIYFPEAQFPFYRVGAPSLVNPALAPPGCRSYAVEFSHVGPADARALEHAAISGLTQAGLCDPRDVVLVRSRTIPVAYVVFDRAYGEARRRAIEYLEARGIFVAGRYGSWEYSSMEDAILSGRAAAAKALA